MKALFEGFCRAYYFIIIMLFFFSVFHVEQCESCVLYQA